MPRQRDPRTQNVGQRVGPLFINFAFTVPALITVVRLVREKERHVTGAMRSTGLRDTAYWASYWLQGAMIALATSLLGVAAGTAFQMEVFLNTDFSISFVFLYVYQLAWFAVAFVVGSLFHQVRQLYHLLYV